MIQNITRSLDNLMKKYTPDPLIYGFILSLFVIILGTNINSNSLSDVITYWGSGFWSLNTFTMQMVMILFLGYVLALSAPIKRMLRFFASLPQNLSQAAVSASLLALLGCYLNWGFGLIISALYCKELSRKFEGRGFAVLVACSYAGFLVWHGGLSGSIPLLVSTPGNFNEQQLGGLVPLTNTLFAPLNLSIVALHFLLMPLLARYLMRKSEQQATHIVYDDNEESREDNWHTPAEKLENSPVLNMLIVSIAFVFIFTQKFSMDLNKINFVLFTLALLFHKTPRYFMSACQQASSKIWPLLIQYPLYAGIMVVMEKSGLAAVLSEIFVNVASAKTLPLFVFLSAGLVNIFIPSGGGQWAVQGPLVISAAQTLHADLNATMMAVAWGDSWTNMIQPFWALPLLAIAGLKARDIMGSLVMIFALSGLIIAGCFIFLS